MHNVYVHWYNEMAVWWYKMLCIKIGTMKVSMYEVPSVFGLWMSCYSILCNRHMHLDRLLWENEW